MRKPTLSGTQSVIGLMAGIFSVFGGVDGFTSVADRFQRCR